MSNTCQNCGEPSKAKHCQICADWLALLVSKKLNLRETEVGSRPKRAREGMIYQLKIAIVSLEFSLALRRKNAELLRKGLRFVVKARA